ncbi:MULTISPECIES: dTDP-4-dehydrorhamnose 3,5-epimerase family protein [unclassified Sphingomonas]|uniref:dTDP-4-dehydrorhamnose 3,5-epimerase family protein n=1 Tax=unclassified Sphingomonas TaxID=196159 RepID=UPI00226B13E7|nr:MULTISPECIES: dTDP-4-dehydrorhamnose 3,5-epimerase family protein [unclassified Sphingomonas]
MEDMVAVRSASVATPAMQFEALGASGACLIHPVVHADDRGSFARSWCADSFAAAGIVFTPVQGNSSLTRHRHTVRGMHFQRTPHADAKVVRCSQGAIYDVIVDLRPQSSTCGRWFAHELSAKNGTILYIPEGFAHGFQTLSDDSIVEYLMGVDYVRELYDGFRYDDPLYAINWPHAAIMVSAPDLNWPQAIGRLPGNAGA